MSGSRMLPDVPQADSKRESGTRPHSNYDTRTLPMVRLGVMIMVIRSLAVLGLTPEQVTLGLLLLCSLSLAVLVLGMMTTLVRSLKG